MLAKNSNIAHFLLLFVIDVIILSYCTIVLTWEAELLIISNGRDSNALIKEWGHSGWAHTHTTCFDA